MRKLFFTLALGAVLLCRFSGAAAPAENPKPPGEQPATLAANTDKDKATFVIANNLGVSFVRFGAEINFKELEKATREALDGKPSRLSDDESKAVMTRFVMYVQKKEKLNAKFSADPPLLTNDDRTDVSYVFGRNLAGSIEDMAPDLNLELFFSIYANCARGGGYNVNMNELTAAAKSYTESVKGNINKRICARNKKAGAEFLAENKKREGVVTTASGLQYMILTEGKGPKPVMPARLIAHVKSRTIDGSMYEDTRDKGKPAHFALDGVIDGWQEALKMMGEGSIWELVVPSDLAFGDNGNAKIQPGSTLIFQIELISANAKEEKAADTGAAGAKAEKK